MSLISDNFFTKESIDFDDLITKLPELDEKLGSCKVEVSSYLSSVQEKIEEQPRRNKQHTSTVNRIKHDLISVKSSLDIIWNQEIILAESSYETLVSELNRVETSISIVKEICEIHKKHTELRSLSNDYTTYGKAVDLLDTLQILFRSFPHTTAIPFIKELEKLINEQEQNISSLLSQEFQKNCFLKKEKQSSVIKLPGNVDIIQYLLPAMYKNGSTSGMLKTLSKFLWEEVFILVIKQNCTVIFKKDETFEIMQTKVNDNKANIIYKDILKNVIHITTFLEKFLNCNLDDNVTLLKFFARPIKSELARIIIDECIFKSVPNNWKEFETFEVDLIESTKELEKTLKPHDLFDEEWECIYKMKAVYCKNRCQYFNEKAREIMKNDLHIAVEVGIVYDPEKPLMEIDEFLRCSISSYIPELFKVGEELICEICCGPVENCESLFMTYKGIFFNYGDFVGTYHQKLLETIPQQVALFYNNCKFLYRQLQEWNDKFEKNEILCEFCDDSSKAFPQVEEVGRLFFDSFLDEQKKQIENILEETNIKNKKTLDKLEENTEKLIRQCLRQQELLKTVWSKVLSYPVYNENIGDILNSMCKFLINALTSVEDIETVVAENLIEVFKIIVHRGPKLFTDSNEISLYVPLWHKFNELMFVLGASLLDINDRWADSKGPLALQFKPYELKQLIRALFQNTERRAAVLAKIRD